MPYTLLGSMDTVMIKTRLWLQVAHSELLEEAYILTDNVKKMQKSNSFSLILQDIFIICNRIYKSICFDYICQTRKKI